MKFNRYMKIRNHYDNKNTAWWLTWNHGLRDAKYVATEKLHGANFSVWVNPDGTVRCGKRSGFLGEEANFYRWREAMEEPALVEWLEGVKADVAKRKHALCFYGELFGGGVQKEVNYGPHQRIRFFDVFDPERDEYWAPKDVYDYIPEHLRVPHVGFYNGIDAALDAEDAFPTLVNPTEGNICEGLVIRPWNMTYKTKVGERFAIKKKNALFKEKAKVPAKSDKRLKINPAVTAALDIITPYITPQRLSNVVSHMGEPSGMKDFGPYLRAFVLDVKGEALLENPHVEDGLDKKERSTVWKTVGSHCSNLLRGYIING